MKKMKFTVKVGVTIYASTGRTGNNQPDRMSSCYFYLAAKGSRIVLLDKNYCFNVATYTLDFDETYRHSYVYAPEESWTTYAGDLGGDTYRQQDYVFQDERYFRICLKHANGKIFSAQEADAIDDIICFYSTVQQEKKPRPCFQKEIEDTVESIQDLKKENSLVLAVLSDTHYTVNGTWEDTAANLHAVHQYSKFDSVIHLGDLTDGMVPREITYTYASKILDDLREMDVPLHIVLGNHDANYFFGNPDVMTISEQVYLYQSDRERYRMNMEYPYYFVDYKKHQVRCFFLSAYENTEKLRYGFDLVQIEWLQRTLQNTPVETAIVLFAHMVPLANLDYWASEIRNGDLLMDVIETHQKQYNNILAYIHGHTHADYVFKERAVPIVSIGCAKCEDMQEKKPEGTFTPKRELHEITQDLWDALIINGREKQLQFIRFGAGKDRVVG